MNHSIIKKKKSGVWVKKKESGQWMAAFPCCSQKMRKSVRHKRAEMGTSRRHLWLVTR